MAETNATGPPKLGVPIFGRDRLSPEGMKVTPALLQRCVVCFRIRSSPRWANRDAMPGRLPISLGDSSIAISSRTFTSEDAVLNAMARLDGHKIWHSAEVKEIP